MKKFFLLFQNVVRADLFSGSLAVWNVRGFAVIFTRPPNPSPDCEAIADEEIRFELFLEYTASWKNANLKRLPRGGYAAARLGFERAFGAKTKRIYQ